MTGTYAGTFSGSGAGAVSLTSVSSGTGGLSLNFTGSTLQWTGGSLTGAVTNLGTLTATTSGVSLGGTLTNVGSVVVDNAVTVYAYNSNPVQVVNQSGATFDLQGTAVLSNVYRRFSRGVID